MIPSRARRSDRPCRTQTVRAVDQALRARGYDVDLSARWDGIVGSDGSLLVNRDELGWLANGVLQFGNMRAGESAPPGAPYVAPELAAKVGWATQSDALLYVNVKGVATTSGKRAASILAARVHRRHRRGDRRHGRAEQPRAAAGQGTAVAAVDGRGAATRARSRAPAR